MFDFLLATSVQLLVAFLFVVALRASYGWMVRKHVAKYVDPEVEVPADFPDAIKFSQTAWSLPADYADWFDTDRFTVHGPRSLGNIGESQSPLHRIMCGGRVEDSEQCFYWGHPQYRQAVAHVLTNQTRESVEILIGKMAGGYWAPMRRTLLEALAEGLIGLEPDFSHLRLEYPAAKTREEAAQSAS